MLVASTVTLPACQRVSDSMVASIRQAARHFETINGHRPNTVILYEGEFQQLHRELSIYLIAETMPTTISSFDGMQILTIPTP